MGFCARRPPLPASPARGEVPHRVLGTILRPAPAEHLPLDGGGWEGVLASTGAGR